MIQELAVQRINCLVNRLFGDEVESSAVRNGSNRCALSWRGDLFDKSGGRASAGSISIPMPVRFLRVLTAATATPESWAREPNMPFSQIGMPADDLAKAACLWPSRSMRVRATIRAAPLALRTWTALRPNAPASSGSRGMLVARPDRSMTNHNACERAQGLCPGLGRNSSSYLIGRLRRAWFRPDARPTLSERPNSYHMVMHQLAVGALANPELNAAWSRRKPIEMHRWH
jgi:hypothetical protein